MRRMTEVDRPATKLEQQLTGEDLQAVTPVDVLREARRRFLRMERLDMRELASDMGVSRATLYRWVGSRDQLLAEVVWSLGEPALRLASEVGEGMTGADRILRIYEQFGEQILAHGPTRHFVDTEPATAIRVMTGKESPNQIKVIAFYRDLIEKAAERGEITLRLPAETVAYVLVRAANAFLWTNLIAGEEPDIHTSLEVARVLLT